MEDDEFERLGLDVPGWKELKEKRQQIMLEAEDPVNISEGAEDGK